MRGRAARDETPLIRDRRSRSGGNASPASQGEGTQSGAVGHGRPWSVEELAAQARDDDVQSFVEFGGAVVGGQDGGEGAQPGELGDG